jgi:hypothetical protein
VFLITGLSTLYIFQVYTIQSLEIVSLVCFIVAGVFAFSYIFFEIILVTKIRDDVSLTQRIPETIPVSFFSFDDLVTYFSDVLKQNGYQQFQLPKRYSRSIVLHWKDQPFCRRVLVFICRVPESADSDGFMEAYRNAGAIVARLNVNPDQRYLRIIYAFSMDHRSEIFNRVIRDEISYEFKSFELLAGICFETRELIISRQPKSPTYRKYRKEFLRLLREAQNRSKQKEKLL